VKHKEVKKQGGLNTENDGVPSLLILFILFSISLIALILLLLEPFQSPWTDSVAVYTLIALSFSLIIRRIWQHGGQQQTSTPPQTEERAAQEAQDLKAILQWGAAASFLAVILHYLFHPRINALTAPNSVWLLVSLLLVIIAPGLQRLTAKKPGVIKALINIQGILAFTVLGLAGIEAGTRSLIALNILPDIPHEEEINANPLPRVHISLGADNIDEPGHPDFKGFLNEAKSPFWLPMDFPGEHYSVADNLRTTTDAPDTYEHTIYVFGGSTVFSRQVPDRYTIPSYLQRFLNAEFGSRFRVVNIGVDGYGVYQQYKRLQQMPLLPGDVVIFYDGENDTLLITRSALYQGYPVPPTMQDPADIDLEKNPDSVQEKRYQILLAIHNLLKFLGRYSEFFHLIQTHNWQLSQHPVDDPEWLDSLVEDYVENYHQIILEAQEHTSSQGAVFLHYLQPTLFAQTELTPHEELILDSFSKDYTYRAIQQAYIQSNPELISAGVHAVDLTGILAPDLRPGRVDIYSDHCHINHIGNRMVAQAIFEDLRTLFE
jgi:lysophospholipase L1-like esterase